MTASVDFAPLADAAADYQLAVGRLEEAAADAEAAWKLLPAALDSPGTQIGVGRFVGPAHQLSTALLQAAAALHGALLSEVQPLRQLSYQAAANPAETNWADSLDATQIACAAAIAAIRGGEAGSVDLPCPAPQGPLDHNRMSPASVLVPLVPTAGLPALGGIVDGATTAAAAGAAGLLGVIGLVLSMGGSTGSASGSPHDQSNRRPVPGRHPVKVTPWTPCDPWQNGPGCEEHPGVDKPGDKPFTGEMVMGDEEPGDMLGTKSDWTKKRSSNDEGWAYTDPDSRLSQRVVEPGHDARYPNGYVQFTNKNGQVIDLNGKTVSPRSDAAHVVRNTNGGFAMPKGWVK